MNWFQENRFLGSYLAALGAGTLAALIFLWVAKSGFETAKAEFEQQATELAALQRHNPFPNEANLRKSKAQAEEYKTAVGAFQEELKTHVLPLSGELKPNEFQARLRQAITSVGEKARVNKMRLPENFFLGFEEFGAALPETEAAPLLGQQLAQTELLVNLLIDARVAAVTSLKRVPLKPAPTPGPAIAPRGAKAAPTPAPLLENAVVELAFSGTPGAVRRALNQISTAGEQLYLIRTLHVLNEKGTGPPREVAGAVTPVPAGSAPANSALHFIVGNEQVQVTARIEMVRFTF